ncbi:MAG: right-handed parallel beta-helix repeat-containing protein, partial [Nitrososphaeria archaeon]
MVKKILVKLLLIILILTLALDINGVGIKTAKGSGTYVGGIISEDTVWTLENSPYILTKHILVQENVSLIIESGVEIRLDGHFIQVDGTLQALGAPERPINIIDSIYSDVKILFTEKSRPWNEEEKTGCLIKFVRIEGSSGHFGLIETTGASPKITNSFLINPAGPALYVTRGGSPSITYCTIKSNGGVSCYAGAAKIVGNIIEGTDESAGEGIVILTLNGTNVEHNIIHKFRNGIIVGSYMPSKNTSNSIVANLVTGNKIGFSFRVIISKESFIPSRLKIFHNSIYNNIEWNVYLDPESWNLDVNMTQNWWGTTDLKAIKAKIYDFEQDFRVGRVLVEPFLTEPHPNTPTLSEVQP